MPRMMMFATAFGALCACAKHEEAATAPVEPAARETAPSGGAASAPLDAAAQPIDGDPASAWIEMTGVWAPAGACGDYAQEWRIEAGAFHLHEMHCEIERLELLRNGVRAIAHCSVEGDDDRVEDAFKFVRRPDYTLSIVNEANDSVTDGLTACGDDAAP
ncbi:MAG: hypothetical protein HXY21_12730 [Parvularculaceae bacterium]|nr:hypothetical protein [Parvularculaceae bacterium]